MSERFQQHITVTHHPQRHSITAKVVTVIIASTSALVPPEFGGFLLHSRAGVTFLNANLIISPFPERGTRILQPLLPPPVLWF